MTALLLSATGAALGSAVAGPIGGILGRVAGAAAGSIIDQHLFGGAGKRQVQGPRLSDLQVQASSEGVGIPQVYGRARVTGQIIWATRFEEVPTTDTQHAGKGLGGGGSGSVTTTTYLYYANVAIGLCEGPIARINRIWADGRVIDLTGITYRVYLGDEQQEPDALIQAKEGTPDVPAYRGLAYVVFEQLPLRSFGNRVPQFSFEVVRVIGRLESRVTAVNLIPGATEFGYNTTIVRRSAGLGASAAENRHTGHTASDLAVSLDELIEIAPQVSHIALVVGWFGDDLRCGVCQIRPGVDLVAKATSGDVWSVAGITRDLAHVTSRAPDGSAAYGGTPSDASVIAAIRYMRDALGRKVTLTPFLFMDIPAGNTLADPWTGGAAQPAYPWRGRITCTPAPGTPGTVDASPTAATQVAAFFGTAGPGDFSVDGATVTYTGRDEWSYRRMVLHCASLCVAAGGVDTFLIGSELRSLTQVRSARSTFPTVDALRQLALDVRGILGPGTAVSYAADWTEYGHYNPPDGSGDVFFPLDRLWSSPAIDFVGVDFYAPLTDWRNGPGHLDTAISASIADRAYLHSRIEGGEAFDWSYADDAGRTNQTRLAITDGAYGKPWIYRAKDLRSWWSNAHVERLGGVEAGRTSWVPASKPIRFTELGVPAVDKGTNEPNLFPDPKSSESGLPFDSNGSRDDFIQRRALEVLIDHFDPATPEGAVANPTSPVDGRRMIDHEASHVWCWDARPWPAFPGLTDVWGDFANWRTGHWLNGRLGQAPVDDLIAALNARFGGPPIDVSAAEGVVQGYVVDRAMSGRAAIEPIASAFGLDMIDAQGTLRFAPRPPRALASFDETNLALDGRSDRAELKRAQETELPASVSFTVSDADRDYRRVAATARRLTGGSKRETSVDMALIEPREQAEAQADLALRRAWIARETARFALPLSALAVEPGDTVDLVVDGEPRSFRVTKIAQDLIRRAEAEGEDPTLAPPPSHAGPPGPSPSPPVFGPPFAVTLDLPALPGDDTPFRPRLAATATPWPGHATLWRNMSGGFAPAGSVVAPATLGTLLDALPAGPVWQLDHAASARLMLASGTLASVSEAALLDGANAAALQHVDGRWEIVQFAGAMLVGPKTYALTTFLRGQAGTEDLAGLAVPPGALLVMLDKTLIALPIALDDIGRAINWRLSPGQVGFDDATALAFTMTAEGVGLLPLAPVEASARRSPAGITIGFIRRTRNGGDGWELAEVPLGEDTESYTIDILAGATVKRTLAATSPAALYAAADELADFGAPQTALSLAIRQVSAVVGPGKALTVTVPVW